MPPAASNKKPPNLAVGTHAWLPTDEDVPRQQAVIASMRQHGVKALDTARMYGGGASETAIGNQGLGQEFAITTKAATGVFEGSGNNIVKDANESLEALKVKKVRTYLLHGPDETVPLEAQMDAIQSLYEEGKFDAFGFSNFTQDQVLEYYNYNKAKNYILPTVYQSSYSPAVRRNETILFPTLRELGFSIQAYSPMAGGLLAKTPDFIEQGKGSWDPSTVMGKVFRDLYYKPSYMNMLENFGRLSDECGISRPGLAYRWVVYHSELDGRLGDEVLVGASTLAQLEETLTEIDKGPLDAWIVERITGLWDIIKDDAPTDNLESVRKVFRA
ncbi:NADP-dependent oxidoreductase domain-containing protein [Thelonectria olida]|uniref:NADP-dependent oxidoreductase domain-containing protein n=1 Tax=Thelonectria olida TaxID=1576542 RepID=A0A9P8W8Z0_9HYPO|nr:NADP-dependent oxidoreductase domain-containing protein [Thelonectria olida]